MTSHSRIRGTGEKKCMPTTWAGRLVAAARAVREMEEVLEAKMVCAGQISSREENTACLASRFSKMASMTRSAFLAPSRVASMDSRARAASLASAVMRPFSTSRARAFSMPALARSRASCRWSLRVTVYPLVMAFWAIPLPIRPAPTTKMFWIAIAFFPFSFFFPFSVRPALPSALPEPD